MNLTLKIWRQENADSTGKMVSYQIDNVSPDMSFLEMMDVLNEELMIKGIDPVAFDHDCREGICGSCGFMINGRPHGPQKATTVCQLHMRSFDDEDDILLEPFRAKSFGVIKDLSVDRKSFDRIISSSGFVSVDTGGAGEANYIPIEKSNADEAFFSGTAVEITPITNLDKSDIGEGLRGPVTEILQSKYSEIVCGQDASYSDWLTAI